MKRNGRAKTKEDERKQNKIEKNNQKFQNAMRRVSEIVGENLSFMTNNVLWPATLVGFMI